MGYHFRKELGLLDVSVAMVYELAVSCLQSALAFQGLFDVWPGGQVPRDSSGSVLSDLGGLMSSVHFDWVLIEHDHTVCSHFICEDTVFITQYLRVFLNQQSGGFATSMLKGTNRRRLAPPSALTSPSDSTRPHLPVSLERA